MKTLNKRISTSTTGVFYKEIISENKKVVDKIYQIRFIDENNKEKLKTVGKYSNGIRGAYCKTTYEKLLNLTPLLTTNSH